MDEVREALEWAREVAEDRARYLSADPEAEEAVARVQERAKVLRQLLARIEDPTERESDAWENLYFHEILHDLLSRLDPPPAAKRSYAEVMRAMADAVDPEKDVTYEELWGPRHHEEGR